MSRDILDKHTLETLYIKLQKTDKEIANFFHLNRTTIVSARKRYGIEARVYTGEIGERFVKNQLMSLGHEVVDMNKTNKLSEYDLLVNKFIRIEVKSAKKFDQRFVFSLTEQRVKELSVSDIRIRLNNGRTKKIFRKTCDLMIFVGVNSRSNPIFWVIPPSDIPDKRQTLSISLDGKYKKYLNRWDLIDDLIEEKLINRKVDDK